MSVMSSDRATAAVNTAATLSQLLEMSYITLKVPKLKGISFEIAIIERYRRCEGSVRSHF